MSDPLRAKKLDNLAFWLAALKAALDTPPLAAKPEAIVKAERQCAKLARDIWPPQDKPKSTDVVANVNGKKYRWPATVKEGEPRGDRFLILRHHGFVVTAFQNSDLHGSDGDAP